MEREIKTARMSAVPLFIFITTTLAEREREREVTKFHERSRYNSLAKLTTFIFFCILRIQGHAKSEKADVRRKQKQDRKSQIQTQNPALRRHIHRFRFD